MGFMGCQKEEVEDVVDIQDDEVDGDSVGYVFPISRISEENFSKTCLESKSVPLVAEWALKSVFYRCLLISEKHGHCLRSGLMDLGYAAVDDEKVRAVSAARLAAVISPLLTDPFVWLCLLRVFTTEATDLGFLHAMLAIYVDGEADVLSNIALPLSNDLLNESGVVEYPFGKSEWLADLITSDDKLKSVFNEEILNGTDESRIEFWISGISAPRYRSIPPLPMSNQPDVRQLIEKITRAQIGHNGAICYRLGDPDLISCQKNCANLNTDDTNWTTMVEKLFDQYSNEKSREEALAVSEKQ